MCGFAALLRARGAPPVDPELLRRMREALAHRGPDDAGLWVDDAGDVGLGFRRLSILDLEGGAQPMATADGRLRVVFNGEIYGFRALRDELVARGFDFRTRADTEVLLHGHRAWGIDGLLARLDGMFAFALWDAEARTLHVARDRLGVKPLFWAQGPGGFACASELPALHPLPWLRRELDPEALRHFLAVSYVPAPLTIWRGVEKLEPGHRLEVRDGRVEVRRRFWAVPDPVRIDDAPPRDALVAELRDRLARAVERQMVADVPVGLFLSSGLDSSALCALYVEHARAGARAFSVGFDEPGFSELPGARAVARRFGVSHAEDVVPPPDEACFRALARAGGEPFADSSSVNLLRLAALAARGVKVVLSGDGGDEILGGYPTYLATRLAPALALVPRAAREGVRRALAALAPPSLGKVTWRLKLDLFLRHADRDPIRAHGSWRRIFAPGELDAVLRPEHRDPGFERRWLARLHGVLPDLPARELDPWNLLMYLDLRAYLADDMLVKVDRTTMAHGLEARVPFLDHGLVEWAMRVPGREKIRGTRTKTLLRDAFAGRIPEDVRRLPKAGFNAPLPRWMLGPVGDLLGRWIDEGRLRDDPWLDAREVARLLAEHRARRADHGHRLFSVMVWTAWRHELGAGASA